VRGKRGDDDVVVGVLGEAEALAGQVAGQLEKRKVRLAGDPQVDLRIDEPNVAGDPQRQPREWVDGRAAVARQPPSVMVCPLSPCWMPG